MKRMWSKNELKKIGQETQKDIATLVDANGHPRFIEGDIEIEEITGVTKTYGKWSLSGSHLLIVLCLFLANTTIVGNNVILAEVDVPDWIKEKIVPIQLNVVELKTETAYSSTLASQLFYTRLNKTSENKLTINKNGALTLDSDKTIRISFDLLIDSE